MNTKFDWNSMSGLPDMSQEALKNYFLYALPPGSFITSLLSCDPWTDVITSVHGSQLNKLVMKLPGGSAYRK